MIVPSTLLFASLAAAGSLILEPRDTAAAFTSSVKSACSSISSKIGSAKVIYSGTTAYNTTLTEFWSGQSRALTPYCVVKPSSSSDVASTVSILTAACVQFSIKSGGHMPWAGAASISNGIEIDMVNMNSVTVSSDKTVATIGPGARWGQVYDTLTPLGLNVAGGRDSTVGVGGLIVGGGYSWFAAASGWVADSLTNVELVTGAGQIINANNKTNSDLFLVLKGGGNNFGIVTSYSFKAFPFGKMWGGIMVYPRSTAAAQMQAFVDFTPTIKTDTAANYISIWSYQQATGADLILNCLEYTKPVVAPPIYNEFLAISPVIASTMRVTNISDLTEELAAATTQNKRYTFITLTFKLSLPLHQQAVNISDQYLSPYRASPNLTWSLLFQPIPRVVQDQSVAAGGNVLGLDSQPGDLMLFLLYITWQNASDDATFYTASRKCIADIKAAGASLGVNIPYMYMNYADSVQDVLDGYGSGNVAKMNKASAKYDPGQVFQNLVPGGWKL